MAQQRTGHLRQVMASALVDAVSRNDSRSEYGRPASTSATHRSMSRHPSSRLLASAVEASLNWSRDNGAPPAPTPADIDNNLLSSIGFQHRLVQSTGRA